MSSRKGADQNIVKEDYVWDDTGNLSSKTIGSNEVDYTLYGLRRPLVKQGWRRVEETLTASTRLCSEIAGRRVSPPARA